MGKEKGGRAGGDDPRPHHALGFNAYVNRSLQGLVLVLALDVSVLRPADAAEHVHFASSRRHRRVLALDLGNLKRYVGNLFAVFFLDRERKGVARVCGHSHLRV